MPEDALRLPIEEVLGYLESLYGEALYSAFDPAILIKGPVSGLKDTQWMKTAKTVGINVRTIGHFWNIIPYALTLPRMFNAIHILPIWEPGVVASLYGPSSWNINPEFFSAALQNCFPHLDTVEKQLKTVINVLHLMGKSVGMDVVPHTDRYSEAALANPVCFEWLQRKDLQIVQQGNDLYRAVEHLLYVHLKNRSGGKTLPEQTDFFYNLPEKERLELMFGEKYDYVGRLEHRKEMVQLLYTEGYETVPATMGPPYRGIEVDPDPEAKITDEEGRIWRDYRITRPESFSRIFGPLARYRLYWSKDDNRNWELDFDQPNTIAWEYVKRHYKEIQAEFGFDFMRGDMSHVQMRPDGVPSQPDQFYDILGAVKADICQNNPSFGYFAESFLAPPGEMAYGDECDHLEASFADSTLGDLQSEPVGTDKFTGDFAQYRKWLESREFAPNFTLITADKDDPRFDKFYLDGNEIRFFIALFLSDMPAYMGMGFECRDPHPAPAPNEHYSKLYVFQMPDGPKGTRGPYVWGKNRALNYKLNRQKILAEEIYESIVDQKITWLLAPDASGKRKVIVWTQADDPQFVFAANLDTRNEVQHIPVVFPEGNWNPRFSTETESAKGSKLHYEGNILKIGPGEGLVWERK
ncbi:MAG: hypothetical protein LCH81_06960 [Bacteroidetes bacterium]|nr:hypothetical protein [Bacteroidota bacterium]